MPEYKPEKCAYCNAETWCELRSSAKWQCRGCKVERFFELVLYPPLGYRLLEWQRKVLREIYGTVNQETGLRRYRRAFISVAKKNGKSFLVGGLPLYHMLMEIDDEPNPLVYGGAASKGQAALVFDSAQQLVNANDDLKRALKVLPSSKHVLRRDLRGKYQVLSADGDLQDGVGPSLSIRDELHKWKTIKCEALRTAMTKGQMARKEPLDIVITTAGAEYESPLWLEEYERAKRVMDGSLRMDSLYVAIWEPDLKRMVSDPEYWKSRAARVAPNPSHEDLGGFLKDDAIVEELQNALATPQEKSKYWRFNLNVPTKAFEDPVIDMQKWQDFGGRPDIAKWDEFDVERLISEWSLERQTCYAGVDASWRSDFTALVLIFPPFVGGEFWTLLPFFWIPNDRVPDLERSCRVPIAAWMDQKFIERTPGGAIDTNLILEKIRWAATRFNLAEVPYDRAHFDNAAMELEREGVTVSEVGQQILSLSAATKWLLESYGEGSIRHGNHPVMNWMASCLQLKYDDRDNCMPVKPRRLKSSKRIDGIQAVVTGLTQALKYLPDLSSKAIEVW